MDLGVLEIVLIALSPFLFHTVLCIYAFFRWLFENFRCGPSIRKRFKLNKDKNKWAIVTGSTSGTGLAFAQVLSEAGFNLLLVSRSEEKLKKISQEIQEKTEVRVAILPLDLENFPSPDYNENTFLLDVVRLTNDETLSLLVCNAGMSDLARHFTDKTLKRNMSIIKLNTIANVAMIQTLLPKLMLNKENKIKSPRGGVITLGALTGLYPSAVYGISSGNKHFMRGFTLAARYEFVGKVDFMIAHPVAVYSNILSEKAKYAIKGRTFAKNALQDFSKGRAESYGHFLHEASTMFMMHFMSRWQKSKMMLLGISHFSDVLNRPVDLTPIEEKLAATQNQNVSSEV